MKQMFKQWNWRQKIPMLCKRASGQILFKNAIDCVQLVSKRRETLFHSNWGSSLGAAGWTGLELFSAFAAASGDCSILAGFLSTSRLWLLERLLRELRWLKKEVIFQNSLGTNKDVILHEHLSSNESIITEQTFFK